MDAGSAGAEHLRPTKADHVVEVQPQSLPTGRHQGKLCYAVVRGHVAQHKRRPQRDPGHRVVGIDMPDVAGVLLTHDPDVQVLEKLAIGLEGLVVLPEPRALLRLRECAGLDVTPVRRSRLPGSSWSIRVGYSGGPQSTERTEDLLR